MNDARCRCGGSPDHDWICAPREARIVLSAADWREMERNERRREIGDEWEREARIDAERGEP